MVLYYIHSLKTLEKLINKNSFSKDYLIISNNLFLYEIATKANLNIKTIDEHIDEILAKEIDDTALNISKTWYVENDRDYLVYKNVNLGYCLSFFVVIQLSNIIKLCRFFEILFKNITFDKVITDYKKESYNINCIINYYSGVIDHKGENGFSIAEIVSHYSEFYFDEVFGLKRGKKSNNKKWISYSISLITKRDNKKNSVLISPSNQISKFIDSIYKKEFDYNILLPESCINKKLIKYALTDSKYYFVNLITKKSTQRSNNKYSIKLSDKYLSKYNLLNLSTMLNNYMHNLISYYLEDFKVLIDNYYDILSSKTIKLIVLPNDCVMENRSLVLVGKELNISSLIVQHGYLGWFGDENHNIGKYSAVFSETTKEILHKKYFIPKENIYSFDYFSTL